MFSSVFLSSLFNAHNHFFTSVPCLCKILNKTINNEPLQTPEREEYEDSQIISVPDKLSNENT